MNAVAILIKLAQTLVARGTRLGFFSNFAAFACPTFRSYVESWVDDAVVVRGIKGVRAVGTPYE